MKLHAGIEGLKGLQPSGNPLRINFQKTQQILMYKYLPVDINVQYALININVQIYNKPLLEGMGVSMGTLL